MELCIYGAAPDADLTSNSGSGSGGFRGDQGSAAPRGGAATEAGGTAAHTEPDLPMPWSCTDDAIMQVRRQYDFNSTMCLAPYTNKQQWLPIRAIL